VEVLDFLHVPPRLRQAAKLLYGTKGEEVVPSVRQDLTQVLEGKVKAVIQGFRRPAETTGLMAVKKHALARIGGYLRKSCQRMHFGEYLPARPLDHAAGDRGRVPSLDHASDGRERPGDAETGEPVVCRPVEGVPEVWYRGKRGAPLPPP
jgi:hypothetical protein